MMIKILGITMTVGGAITLIMGVLGAFGNFDSGVNPYALCILGIIFFLAGISLLKYQNDTDEI